MKDAALGDERTGEGEGDRLGIDRHLILQRHRVDEGERRRAVGQHTAHVQTRLGRRRELRLDARDAGTRLRVGVGGPARERNARLVGERGQPLGAVAVRVDVGADQGSRMISPQPREHRALQERELSGVGAGRQVADLARLEEGDGPPCPGEHERRRQTGDARSDDDDVVPPIGCERCPGHGRAIGPPQ